MELLCFPINKLSDPFTITNANANTPYIVKDRDSVDWDKSMDLTVTLNAQIYNEYLSMRLLAGCSTAYLEGDQNPIFRWDSNMKPIKLAEEISDKTVMCKKFLKIFYDYCEVFSRDQDALAQKGFNVKIYAIVLLKDKIYQGHIYVWPSPTNSNYVMAMGIRNRIDSVFLTDRIKVSTYLLEGVRLFASSLKAIPVIVQPKPIMRTILPQLGFEQTSINFRDIGYSINSCSFISICYILQNETSLVSDVNFNIRVHTS